MDKDRLKVTGHIVDCNCDTNQKISCKKRLYSPHNVPSRVKVITPTKYMDDTVVGICLEASTTEEKFACKTQPDGLTLEPLEEKITINPKPQQVV